MAAADLVNAYEQNLGNRNATGSLFGNPWIDISNSIAQGRIVAPQSQTPALDYSNVNQSGIDALNAGGSMNLSTGAPNIPTVTKPQNPVPTTTTTTTQPRNPGSQSITYDEAIRRGYDWNKLPGGYSQDIPQQQGISDADLNSAYNPIFDYLNQAESSLRGGFGGIQQDIGNQYGVSANTLGTSRSQNIASLDTNASKVQQTKEDAMSQARRLYNELIGGYGQRFGGSTSAGEAARTLAGNEAQRTMGGVNRDFGNNMALIQQKKVEVDQNYQTGLQQLQATRDQALNQANRDFQQKLLDISNTRASTASEKAQQKLAALQELRNQAYNIQLQNTQFQQQLALQKQADSTNLDQYMQQFTGAAQAGQTAQQGYNPQVSSNLQVGNTGVGGQSALTGQIGNRKDLTNQYTGAIAPTSDERLFSNIFGR